MNDREINERIARTIKHRHGDFVRRAKDGDWEAGEQLLDQIAFDARERGGEYDLYLAECLEAILYEGARPEDALHISGRGRGSQRSRDWTAIDRFLRDEWLAEKVVEYLNAGEMLPQARTSAGQDWNDMSGEEIEERTIDRALSRFRPEVIED